MEYLVEVEPREALGVKAAKPLGELLGHAPGLHQCFFDVPLFDVEGERRL